MREEIWRDIEGYEGYYMVSNMGNVKSLERTVWDNRGYYKTIQERILRAGKGSDGYLQVGIYRERKRKMYLVHRLVASAFCENPHGYTEVNHIDEDKTNNCVENLEYCSRSYNLTYNDRAKKAGRKAGKKKSKPVIAIDKITGLILEFPSAKEAESHTGIAQSHICACCKGKQNSAGGFYWMYANVNDDDTE